jgi:hypothetical protein
MSNVITMGNGSQEMVGVSGEVVGIIKGSQPNMMIPCS